MEEINEVLGFKIGDRVRLSDGDGRTHIIKSFEKQLGIHGPDFYVVNFEDDTASDILTPDHTHMVKLEGPRYTYKGYVARDYQGGVNLHLTKPIHIYDDCYLDYWVSEKPTIRIDEAEFPNLTSDDDPIEVEFCIKFLKK